MPVAAVRKGGRPTVSLGIADHDLRQHQRVEDDLLLMRRLVGHDAGAADLRARAGRGRHGDDRRDALRIGPRPPIADVLEIPHRARLAVHEGDRLADIERRAAADRDDAVMLALAEGREPGVDIGLRRIAAHIGEDRDRQARRLRATARAFAITGPSARPYRSRSGASRSRRSCKHRASSASRPGPMPHAVG